MLTYPITFLIAAQMVENVLLSKYPALASKNSNHTFYVKAPIYYDDNVESMESKSFSTPTKSEPSIPCLKHYNTNEQIFPETSGVFSPGRVLENTLGRALPPSVEPTLFVRCINRFILIFITLICAMKVPCFGLVKMCNFR